TAGDLKVFAEMAQGVRERRQLDVVYWSASRAAETRRRLDPYHLACLFGDWYLVAYCHLRQAVRMFVPARIRSLVLTADTFDRPAHFDMAKYLAGAFRTIRGHHSAQWATRGRITSNCSHLLSWRSGSIRAARELAGQP